MTGEEGSKRTGNSHYAGLVCAVLLFLFVSRRPGRCRGNAAGFVVVATGFTGMLMACSLIITFQIYYGNIFHYIGLLTALFMLGRACGSALSLRRGNSLLLLEMVIVCHALLVWVFLGAALGETEMGRPLFLLLCFSSGLLTGMSIRLPSASWQRADGAAGRLYALYLSGALVAALPGPVLLIPALGMRSSLFLVVALKAAATLLIATDRGGESKKRDLTMSPFNGMAG